MVDVRVTNSATRKSNIVVAATAQALLEAVQSSRHFGPGTLEDASERLVSDGYALSDGLELTWFPKAAAAAQPQRGMGSGGSALSAAAAAAEAGGGGAALGGEVGAVSPRSRLAQWMRANPLPEVLTRGPSSDATLAMSQLIKSMPLPLRVRKLLLEFLYVPPATGLFAAVRPSLIPVTAAFERHDLVSLLVERATSLGDKLRASTLIMHGLRRTGKTFSVPWALAEAIAKLEDGLRPTHMLVVDCSAATPPDLEEFPILLAVAAYLRVPAVFDEFIKNWENLPNALRAFLDRLETFYPDLKLLPLQFLLMDSMQSAVQGITSSTGSLYARHNIGIPRAVQMPQPSLQLIAGMLRCYHADQYPGSLLRAVATSGRYLDRYFMRPMTPVQELSREELSNHCLLKGEHLDEVEKAVINHGYAQVGEAALAQLLSRGVFEESPFGSRQVQLVEPQLVTVAHLARCQAFAHPSKLEPALQEAEGKVLEILLRKDLVKSLMQRLGLTGNPELLWGDIANAELDLVLHVEGGPLVLVSCKRQHEKQSLGAFTSHVKRLQDAAKAVWINHSKSEKQRQQYKVDPPPAVVLMRLIVSAPRLIFAAVSAYSTATASSGSELAVCMTGHAGSGPAAHNELSLEFEGQNAAKPFSLSAWLLHDLVEPQAAVPFKVASLCPAAQAQ